MNTKISNKLMTIIAGTTAALFLNSNNSVHAFTVSSFSPIGFSDAVAGITGFEIEDFEDTTLIPGLTVEWVNPDLGPVSTLPRVVTAADFPSTTDDAWDGVGFLTDSQQGFIALSETTILNFSNNPTSVGIGVSNLNFPASASLSVNGVDLGTFNTFTPPPIAGTGIKNTYLRIDANSGETINSVSLTSSLSDLLVYDRVAVGEANAQDIPEGSNVLALGAIALVGIFTLKKSKNQSTPKPVKVER